MKVLVVNCGSSSIKYQLYEMPEKRVISKGLVERIGEENAALEHHDAGDDVQRLERQIADHEEGMALILETLTGDDGALESAEEVDAIGHRVVHGGEEFTGSVLVTPEVIASIERFADLAPLHNPPNLTGIRAAMHALPHVPQVACFDTAFHSTIPEVAYTYALPYQLYEQFGIRRYGFHGTSHRYVARRAAKLLDIDKYAINCINRFITDSDAEIEAVRAGAAALGVEVHLGNHWEEGGAGAEDLAKAVVKLAESGSSQFSPLYEDALPLWEKIKTVATKIYGADDIIADKAIRTRIAELEKAGYGHFPVCIAKTQYSFSTDPNLKGAPTGHVVPVREVRLSGGAEFIVVLCGQILTMPGLPRVPAAEAIGIDDDGEIFGLF